MDLEELSRQSAPKDEIAARIEATRKERADAAQRHQQTLRRRRILLVFLMASVTAGAVAAYYWDRWFPHPTPTQAHVVPTESPSRVDVTARSVQDACQVVACDVHLSGLGQFSVKAFDFFANRFLRGRQVLTNADVLKSTFSEPFFRQALNDSWVLIFAGASFEDQEDHNLELCGRRVRYVAQLLSGTERIAPRGLWAIRAGEYREIPSGRTTPLSEDEEETQAKLMGERKLATQRRLLIIAIAPVGNQRTSPTGQAVVNEIAKLLLADGTIPNTYDYASTVPAPLDLLKGQANSNGKMVR